MDFTQPALAWRTIAPMPSVRWFPNSALLPDGTLFIVGSGRAAEVDAIDDLRKPLDTENGAELLK